MPALHFETVLMLGAAIAALLALVCLLLTPALAGNRATRLLSVGNACFTAMLVARLALGQPPSQAGYALIWSMLVFAAAMHLFALQDFTGTPARRRSAVLGLALCALWASLASSASAQLGAVIAGASTFAFYAAAARASLRLAGRPLALARRTLATAFGACAFFAATHVHSRGADFLAGVAEVPATAHTYFGSILLFCAINVGFLLLLYLQLAERVNRLAQTDELTGALNRRGLAEQLGRLRTAAPPGGALVLIDIDRFKSINDTWGHAVGDEVLRWFAATLRRFMRHDDLLTRMGGEEFCLLLPDVTEARARQIAERIRQEFEAHCVAPTTAGPLRVTASFGMATFDARDPGLDARLREADAALYAAKRAGRNRVVWWSPTLADGASA
jgi:diguanylate cyclase (GGDEF)-like protein